MPVIYQEGWGGESLFRPHRPAERALARVSKGEGGASFETPPFGPLLRMKVRVWYAPSAHCPSQHEYVM
jgi:hypothetical protein